MSNLEDKRYSRLADIFLAGCMCGHGESCEVCDPMSSFNQAKEEFLEIPEFKDIYNKKLSRRRLRYSGSAISKFSNRRLVYCFTKQMFLAAKQITSRLYTYERREGDAWKKSKNNT